MEEEEVVEKTGVIRSGLAEAAGVKAKDVRLKVAYVHTGAFSDEMYEQEAHDGRYR